MSVIRYDPYLRAILKYEHQCCASFSFKFITYSSIRSILLEYVYAYFLNYLFRTYILITHVTFFNTHLNKTNTITALHKFYID